MKTAKRHEEILKQLPGFVLGEVGGWQKWRLSRHIAGCPLCQKERDRLSVLYGQLRTLQSETPPPVPILPMVPNIAPQSITLGGKVMNKRMVFAASAALCLLVGGGAIAYKLRPPTMLLGVGEQSDANPNITKNGGWSIGWYFYGQYQGKVEVFDTTGKSLTKEQYLNGSSASSPLLVRRQEELGGKERILFENTIHGFGKHELTNVQGQKIGYVVLSPMNAEEKQIKDEEEKSDREAWLDYYNSVERISPTHPTDPAKPYIGGRGYGSEEPFFQMVGGTVDYPVFTVPKELQSKFAENDYAMSFSGGISWKVYGDVKVKITSYLPEMPISIFDWKGSLPPATVVQTCESKSLPKEEDLSPAEADYLQYFLRNLHLRPLGEPEVYWTIADISPAFKGNRTYEDNVVDDAERWKKIKRTGSFKGYGTHEVKDTQGKVLMRIEVSPKPKAVTKPA
jgi:hypothetical protein